MPRYIVKIKGPLREVRKGAQCPARKRLTMVNSSRMLTAAKRPVLELVPTVIMIGFCSKGRMNKDVDIKLKYNAFCAGADAVWFCPTCNTSQRVEVNDGDEPGAGSSQAVVATAAIAVAAMMKFRRSMS